MDVPVKHNKNSPTSTVSEYVKISITSSARDYECEKAFKKSITFKQLKEKLEMIVGSESKNMKLTLFHEDDSLVDVNLNELDDAQLNTVPISNGMKMHVEDPTIQINEYNDLSKVEKYTISEKKYDMLSNSLRSYCREHKVGPFEQNMLSVLNSKGIEVGKRCSTLDVSGKLRLARIAFIGPTNFSKRTLIGVIFDEAVGEHNGTINDITYFECEDNHGKFTQINDVWLESEVITQSDFNFDDENKINPEDII
ncbi:hypothetical protein GJ496_011979 [Pomphorhynchus laevis]|nr:hypothetical protein GJ496_011979 [Pomphorhynchus laevis]